MYLNVAALSRTSDANFFQPEPYCVPPLAFFRQFACGLQSQRDRNILITLTRILQRRNQSPCSAACTQRESHLSCPLQYLPFPPRQQSSLPIIFRIITNLLLPPVPNPQTVSSSRNSCITRRRKEGQAGIFQEWTHSETFKPFL
jgi:hypothetical protein